MKRITLITTLLLVFTLSALSQSKTEIESRFACPNEKKDTLFVINDMVDLMTSLWQGTKYKYKKPIIVPVKVIHPYVKRYGLDLKSRIEQ